MKYFYTDPLKAAWMAREHGFKFYDLLYDKKISRHLVYIIDELLEQETELCYSVKLYLSPDCHEMLMPQVGDLIIQRGNIRQFDKIGTITHITKDGVCACYADYMDDAKAHEGSAVQMIFNKKAEILQRNGKAFFMPKVEADA